MPVAPSFGDCLSRSGNARGVSLRLIAPTRKRAEYGCQSAARFGPRITELLRSIPPANRIEQAAAKIAGMGEVVLRAGRRTRRAVSPAPRVTFVTAGMNGVV